jgi:dihydropteroate synthase
VSISADLVIPADDTATLQEIASWDGFRPATFSASEFPVDVVRLEDSPSPPLVLSRAKRAESLKALPATIRQRAQSAFERAARAPGSLTLARDRSLDLSHGPVVMGVVNVTPDSFSDGGLFFDRGRAITRALEMFEEGAAIVDVGGESTRPSSYGEAQELTAEEEIRRVVPVIDGVRRTTSLPLSVDTRKAAVAREATAAGADLVNDVSALRYDPDMAEVVARAGAGVLLMHMKGNDPRRMQDDVSYGHPIGDIAALLAEAAGRALESGIAAGGIAVDPGLGFGKSPEGSLLLLRHLAALRSLGFPVAVGASRKAFVRRASGIADDAPPADRLPGSLASLAASVEAGVAIVRVHDVAESIRFLRVLSAIRTPALRVAQPAGMQIQ